MAPSPENDNAPKAPDKSDINKCEKQNTTENNKEKDKDEKTLSNLNDGELKALLDEAINYKNPKDREGKSKLFKDLLTQAEESERIARATSAGGSEVARHYNTSARHQRRAGGGGGDHRHHHHHGRHQRHRKPASISENVVQGGSLDNLAKEEMFLESTNCLVDKMKSVSARQKEGGSLPCDVNSSASVVPARDYQFLEEARRKRAMKDKEYTAIDIESSAETQRLLDHDTLAQSFPEHQDITILPRYTTNATLQISATPVDDPISLELDNTADKKPYDLDTLQTKVHHSKYSVYIPTYRSTEDRRTDENGNALHQNQAAKAKKKKTQTDKNVVVLTAERVEGHRSDIINDVDKLIQYIRGDKGDSTSGGKGGKANVHKSKQLHKQHASEEGPSNRKKQRANSSKGKESRSELKKSNSLGEIPTATLEEFAFAGSGGGADKDCDGKVVMRQKTQGDKPKERRSWGNVEAPQFQILSSNASTENLETTDNWVVTKPKKKSKKRRNSVSSGRRQTSSDSHAKHAHRARSPDKSARSVPHSEKSNDSSDVDSVHSLPLNVAASYADIAKNEKKPTPEKPGKEKSPTPPPDFHAVRSFAATPAEEAVVPPPDVNSIRSFPAISKKGEVKCAAGVGGKSGNVSPGSKGAVTDVDVTFGDTNDAGSVTSNIQNDLTIIHSNEIESIQFNAQMLPPNIPDVQTIEKMHFLNCPPPQPPPHRPQPPSEPAAPKTDVAAAVVAVDDNCDSSERTNVGEVDGARPPPVVILSGQGNKEVTDLEFGFDVNEQLLNEDICDNFVARFVPPEGFDCPSLNHDKIVNFIGSAWDAVMDDSDGEVQYYTEDL